jgi:3-oxoacyl-[acyl-carrier-protein] synthase III
MAHILGMARALPDTILEGSGFASTTALSAAGFERVRCAASTSDTVALQLQACRAALADAACSAEEVSAVLVVRNGVFRAFESTWLSLLLARELGCREPVCLDVKGCGCAGAIQLIDIARRVRGHGQRALLVGGGACGASARWLGNPPPDEGEPLGLLLGDGAYALVLGDEGMIEVVSAAVYLDPAFASAPRLEGADLTEYVVPDDAFRDWLSRSSLPVARVILDATRTAGIDRRAPAFVVGSNAGRAFKEALCREHARGSSDPRFAAAARVQIAAMAEHGHLFGGDAVSNLCSLREAGLFRAGDSILALEVGDTYLYSAARLRITTP